MSFRSAQHPSHTLPRPRIRCSTTMPLTDCLVDSDCLRSISRSEILPTESLWSLARNGRDSRVEMERSGHEDSKCCHEDYSYSALIMMQACGFEMFYQEGRACEEVSNISFDSASTAVSVPLVQPSHSFRKEFVNRSGRKRVLCNVIQNSSNT